MSCRKWRDQRSSLSHLIEPPGTIHHSLRMWPLNFRMGGAMIHGNASETNESWQGSLSHCLDCSRTNWGQNREISCAWNTIKENGICKYLISIYSWHNRRREKVLKSWGKNWCNDQPSTVHGHFSAKFNALFLTTSLISDHDHGPLFCSYTNLA